MKHGGLEEATVALVLELHFTSLGGAFGIEELESGNVGSLDGLELGSLLSALPRLHLRSPFVGRCQDFHPVQFHTRCKCSALL
jgi:hypothetical protein